MRDRNAGRLSVAERDGQGLSRSLAGWVCRRSGSGSVDSLDDGDVARSRAVGGVRAGPCGLFRRCRVLRSGRAAAWRKDGSYWLILDRTLRRVRMRWRVRVRVRSRVVAAVASSSAGGHRHSAGGQRCDGFRTAGDRHWASRDRSVDRGRLGSGGVVISSRSIRSVVAGACRVDRS